MLDFLIGVLTFALGIVGVSGVTTSQITDKISEHLGEVSAPAGDVEIPPANFEGQSQENNNNEQGQNSSEENSNGDGETEQAVDPDTDKVAAHNTASDTNMNSIANVAVENSPVLESEGVIEIPIGQIPEIPPVNLPSQADDGQAIAQANRSR